MQNHYWRHISKLIVIILTTTYQFRVKDQLEQHAKISRQNIHLPSSSQSLQHDELPRNREERLSFTPDYPSLKKEISDPYSKAIYPYDSPIAPYRKHEDKIFRSNL